MSNKLSPLELQKFREYSKDPYHFISECCKLSDPIRGLIPIKIRQYQALVISDLEYLEQSETYRLAALAKGRQLGITSIAFCYALWRLIFRRNFTVGLVSSSSISLPIFERIYKALPQFIKDFCPISVSTKKVINFENGSKLLLIKHFHDVHSTNFDLGLVDEAAFCLNQMLYDCMFPNFKKLFVFGTPTFTDTTFYSIWDSLPPEQKRTITTEARITEGVMTEHQLDVLTRKMDQTSYSREIMGIFCDY